MGFGRKFETTMSDDEKAELDALEREQKTEEFESLTMSCQRGLGAPMADNHGRKKKALNPDY